MLAYFISLIRHRDAIIEIAKRHLENQHKNKLLGAVWNYLQPLLLLLILFFVIKYGLKANPAGNSSFLLYLLTGILPWGFFTSTLTTLTHIIKDYSFLVKKGKIRLSIIHIGVILGAFTTHIFQLSMVMVLGCFLGAAPDWSWLMLFYLFGSLLVLLLGLGWFFSAICLFIEDLLSFIDILLYFGFWVTPVFWNRSFIPESYQWIVSYNPMFYIINGYRMIILHHDTSWIFSVYTLFFWGITLSFLLLGALVFKQLRPHYGDVLP